MGWLGAKGIGTIGGGLDLVRMGVRLYDPILGRFLEVDPVPGGNVYDYCGQDPVNCWDLEGTAAGGTTNTLYVLTKNGKMVYVGKGREYRDRRFNDITF